MHPESFSVATIFYSFQHLTTSNASGFIVTLYRLYICCIKQIMSLIREVQVDSCAIIHMMLLQWFYQITFCSQLAILVASPLNLLDILHSACLNISTKNMLHQEMLHLFCMLSFAFFISLWKPMLSCVHTLLQKYIATLFISPSLSEYRI